MLPCKSMSYEIVHATALTHDTPIVLRGNCHIVGDIPDKTQITIHGNANIVGNIGQRVKLRCYGNLQADHIGKETQITAFSVDAKNVGQDSNITTIRGGMRLEDVSLRVHLDAAESISFKNAYSCLTAQAGDRIKFNQLGSNSHLVGHNIEGKTIGHSCSIKARGTDCIASTVGGHTNIEAARNVNISTRIDPTATIYYGHANRSKAPKSPAKALPSSFIRNLGHNIMYDPKQKAYWVPTSLIDPEEGPKINSPFNIDLYCAIINNPGAVITSMRPADNALTPHYILQDGTADHYSILQSDGSKQAHEQLRDAISAYLDNLQLGRH